MPSSYFNETRSERDALSGVYDVSLIAVPLHILKHHDSEANRIQIYIRSIYVTGQVPCGTVSPYHSKQPHHLRIGTLAHTASTKYKRPRSKCFDSTKENTGKKPISLCVSLRPKMK